MKKLIFACAVLLLVSVSFGAVCHFHLPGDVDGNCEVNLVDFAEMAKSWLVNCDDTPYNLQCTALDLDDDGYDAIADCDDNDPTIYPGATDIPNDGIDQNCDGVDFAFPIPSSNFQRVPSNSSVATTTFEMGDHFGVGNSDELPIHTVTLDAFYMCKYEVTNRQYRIFLNDALDAGEIIVDSGVVYASNDSSRSEPYFSTFEASKYSQISYNSEDSFINITRDNVDTSDHPATDVSWYGAKVFCDFYGYRLPTEAEWECAARSGNLYYQYPWGSNSIDSSKCNYSTNNPLNFSSSPYTTLVGYYSSPTGFYDMAGNVWEWCNDWYGSYSSTTQTSPTGPTTGSNRVIRGGNWITNADYCRVARRSSNSPSNRNNGLGFRVCLD